MSGLRWQAPRKVWALPAQRSRSRRKQAEQAASQIRTAFKAQTARMQRMAAYPMLQMALKNRTLKQEQRIRTRLCNSYLRVISSCQTMC